LNRSQAKAGLVATGVLATLVIGCGQDTSSIRRFDWGFALSASSPDTNVVRPLSLPASISESFEYYTGGQGGGAGESIDAPTDIFASVQRGPVTVNLLAFTDTVPEDAEELVAQVADVIQASVALVAPEEGLFVEVDYHVMPDGKAYSLARHVSWEPGHPLVLAIFSHLGRVNPGTPVHELYHLLASLWSVGTKDPEAEARMVQAGVFEEAAAHLFTSCGTLGGLGLLDRGRRGRPTVIFVDERFEVPLDRAERARILELATPVSSSVVGDLFNQTLLQHVLGDLQVIDAGSDPGMRLLELCRAVLRDPDQVRNWFNEQME